MQVDGEATAMRSDVYIFFVSRQQMVRTLIVQLGILDVSSWSMSMGLKKRCTGLFVKYTGKMKDLFSLILFSFAQTALKELGREELGIGSN